MRDILQEQYDKLKEKADKGILSKKDITALTKLEHELAANDTTVFKNAKDAAEYASCSTRTIWDAVKKGLLIKQPDKSYLQDDLDTWLSALGKRPAQSKRNKEKSGQKELFDRSDEEARYRHFRATRERLIVERMQGELIPVDEVKRQFVTRAHEFKTSLLLLSRSIAHIIAEATGMESKKVAKIIDAEVNELLSQISRPIEMEID